MVLCDRLMKILELDEVIVVPKSVVDLILMDIWMMLNNPVKTYERETTGDVSV